MNIHHVRACPFCRMSKYLIVQRMTDFIVCLCLNCRKEFTYVARRAI